MCEAVSIVTANKLGFCDPFNISWLLAAGFHILAYLSLTLAGLEC